MLLWILAHRKGYRQVQTLFGYSLQTISHHFKRDLRVVVALAANMVKSHHDYNDGAPSHSLNAARYPLFQVKISITLPLHFVIGCCLVIG